MNPFFLEEGQKTFNDFPKDTKSSNYTWLISADKVFSSDIEGFEEYARIHHIKYNIYRSFLFEETKTAESSVCAREVHIYMCPGSHCAMLEGRMAKNVIIPKVTIQKIMANRGTTSVLEKKEFKQCVISSFELQDDEINFSFRYRSFSDSYTDYKNGGEKKGSAAVQIDLAKWEIKES